MRKFKAWRELDVNEPYGGRYTDDPIVNEVIKLLKARSDQGMETYGQPMTRTDTTTLEWANHAREEALDFACYLTRLMSDIANNNWYNNNALHGSKD